MTDFNLLFGLQDFLIEYCIVKLDFHWNDNDTIPYLEDNSGNIISADRLFFLPIKDTKCIFNNGEDMVCDGLVFFGDGTLEFHDKFDYDSYCWDEFMTQSIIEVAKAVSA